MDIISKLLGPKYVPTIISQLKTDETYLY